MKKLTILIALVLLGACTPKKQSVRANTSGTATIGGLQLGANCAGQQSQGGVVYDNSAQSFYFENRVKEMLSSWLQPADVGTIISQGVKISGTVKLDSNGNVLGAQSTVKVLVEDSFYFADPSKPILITYTQTPTSTITGQFSANGVGTLTIKDEYGQMKFDGSVDAQKFSGTVTFQNTRSVTGGAPASGTLGQFFIYNCGFLQ